MPNVAVFENVYKRYPTGLFGRYAIQALQGVDLRIPAGRVFGLLGPNRAGKTTLVKLLLRLCRPTSGSVLRFDRPATDASTLAKVGYMHENQHFPRYLTASEILHLYGALTLVPPNVLKARVAELLEKVGLADRSREPITQFSKGMVQRLGLAQALLNDPELLVLDEPSEGLDITGRQLLRQIIAERKQRGLTVLLVSHVHPEVELVCDRVAVVNEGKIVREADLAELVRDPKTGQKLSLESVLQPLYEKRAL